MSLREVKDLILGLTKKVDELIKLTRQLEEEEDKLSAMTAKIIKHISNKIDECKGTKNLAEKLEKMKKVIATEATPGTNSGWIGMSKYSYPNYKVGNPFLGISRNPKALTWPFRLTNKK